MYSTNIAYNHLCPNISKVIRKHWNWLEIIESLEEVFKYHPIIAFRWNRNLKELIRSSKIEKNEVKKRQIQKLKPSKCSPCLTNLRSFFCKQIRKKTVFKSQQTRKIYKIFHNVNCASSLVMYLIGCISCNRQYVGKAETSFSIWLNNHRKDVKKVDAIMVCKYFQQLSHNFNKHAKFTIIDQLTNTSKSKGTLTQRLIESENFWILTLFKMGIFGAGHGWGGGQKGSPSLKSVTHILQWWNLAQLYLT